ncbi:MAG: RluA family pseudouridine synthase [Chlamydiales bacterium]|nr:RluA family pseudouridine synthase [Chlamydiales bacterium]
MAQKIEILYEDNHLIAVNKPVGLLTQPTSLVEDSLLVRLKAFIKERDHKPGRVFLEPIHRIDKPVSGVVVFAKTSKALSRLMKSIRERKCKKVYLAKVSGQLPASAGIIEHFLVHDDFRARVVKDEKEGKKAILSYRLIKKEGPFSLLEVYLETGRYHQIRVQLAYLHCPIVGDHKYGSKETLGENEIALHHHSFSIPHPITDEIITITASKPLWAS